MFANFLIVLIPLQKANSPASIIFSKMATFGSIKKMSIRNLPSVRPDFLYLASEIYKIIDEEFYYHGNELLQYLGMKSHPGQPIGPQLHSISCHVYFLLAKRVCGMST